MLTVPLTKRRGYTPLQNQKLQDEAVIINDSMHDEHFEMLTVNENNHKRQSILSDSPLTRKKMPVIY